MLENIDLFSCLDDEGVEAIKQISEYRAFQRGLTIIEGGDLSSDLFLLLEGEAQAVTNNPSGRRFILNTFKAGQYFGEMSFIDGKPRSADVQAKTYCRTMVIPRERLRNLFPKNPELCFKILNGLSTKLRQATCQIEDLVFRDVYQRVARYISQNAKLGKRGEDHVEVTHRELADAVGSSREMVTRVLKEQARHGFVKLKRKKIQHLKKIPMDD